MAASRIANVSAVLRTGRGTAPAAPGMARDVGALCRALFEEVVEIADGGDAAAASGPRAGLAAALSAATGERVLVVEAAAGRPFHAEVVLALVAWPEADAVVAVDRAGLDLPFGLYRREACLAKLAAQSERAGSTAPGALEGALAIERVPLAVLGLAGGAVVRAPLLGKGG